MNSPSRLVLEHIASPLGRVISSKRKLLQRALCAKHSTLGRVPVASIQIAKRPAEAPQPSSPAVPVLVGPTGTRLVALVQSIAATSIRRFKAEYGVYCRLTTRRWAIARHQPSVQGAVRCFKISQSSMLQESCTANMTDLTAAATVAAAADFAAGADNSASLPPAAAPPSEASRLEQQEQQQQQQISRPSVTPMRLNAMGDLPAVAVTSTEAAAAPTAACTGTSNSRAISSTQSVGLLPQLSSAPVEPDHIPKMQDSGIQQQQQQYDGVQAVPEPSSQAVEPDHLVEMQGIDVQQQQHDALEAVPEPNSTPLEPDQDKEMLAIDIQQQHNAVTAAVGKPQKPTKPPKPQPTHFMALQVSHSPKVIASVKTIQQKLIEADEHLKPCCLDPITAHITIMVLYLPQQEQVDAAEVAMAELGSVLAAKGMSTPIQLQLKGLSHFKHQVLYLEVAPGPARDSLMALGAAIIEHFTAAAAGSLLVPGEDKPFIPHITVAKTSRVMGKARRGKGRKGRLNIPESAWQDLAELDSGHVSIDEIQICSMQGRKPGRYYKVTHHLKLVQPAVLQPPAPEVTALRKRQSPLAAARQRFKRLLSACACGIIKRQKP